MAKSDLGRRPRARVAPRVALLLALTLASTWLLLESADTGSLVPAAWPASGLLVAALVAVRASRDRLLVSGAALATLLAAHLAAGLPVAAGAGFSLVSTVEALVVHRLLHRGLRGDRAALVEEGDVARSVTAIAAGAGLAAVGYAVIDAATGNGSPLLGAAAVLGTHAAGTMVLLPLFVRTPGFPPIAEPRERTLQGVIALGTTALIFSSSDVPPAVFLVMPMFAWLGYRGTLREASAVLAAVAVVGTALTAWDVGPVFGLQARYDLAPEWAIAFMQLFLLDCGLILLPLSVAVTQQRMAAAQAATGRQTLDRLVTSARGTAIIATDAEGHITLFNPGAEGMLGWSAGEVIGRSQGLFHGEDEVRRHATELRCPPTFSDVSRALAASEDPRRLWHYRTKRGEERTMLMTVASVPDDDGRIGGFISTAEDVTEREQVQEALVAALRHQQTAVGRLQELDRIKSDFVSTVSHELRTPITSIVGYLEMLQGGAAGELSEAQHNFVGRVERNSRRLLLLVDDLLTLSQIESSSMVVRPTMVDLREVAAAARRAVEPLLEQRDLCVEVVLPEHPLPFLGDAVQLERVLVNLLANAVKFTPDGGVVGLRVELTEHVVAVVVTDTGIGIPEHEQEQLFTRFFRSAAAGERAIQGSGLGLAIVKSIVAVHGGTVTLESAADAGTTVTVTLPRGGVGSASVAPAGAAVRPSPAEAVLLRPSPSGRPGPR